MVAKLQGFETGVIRFRMGIDAGAEITLGQQFDDIQAVSLYIRRRLIVLYAGVNDIRLFMAHGWVSAELGAEGTNIIEFFRYERTGEGQFQLMRGRTDVARLREAADDIEKYSNRTLTLFRKIYEDKGLEANGGGQRFIAR